MVFALLCILNCTQHPAHTQEPATTATETQTTEIKPVVSAPTQLSKAEQQQLAEKTVQHEDPNIRLDPLHIDNPHLTHQLLSSPLEQSSCWSAFAGEHPLHGFPDIQYICVSAQGKLWFPFNPEDFSQLLILEDTAQWTDKQYLEAAELYIHLQNITRQHAGWISLKNRQQFLDISFNMKSVAVSERKNIARQITPPVVQKSKESVTIQLFTWTLIGGFLDRWMITLSNDHINAKSERLGRFGGGGYD